MKRLAIFLIGVATIISSLAAGPAVTVDASHPSGKVSPMLYGLMTEEINHSYDGGLYAELIRNRAFLDDAVAPVHWSVLNEHGAEATIALDSANAFNSELTASLWLTVTKATQQQPAGVANNGYWGIPVRPKTRYRVSLILLDGRGALGRSQQDLETAGATPR